MLLNFYQRLEWKGKKEVHAQILIHCIPGIFPFFRMGCMFLRLARISYSACSLARELTCLDHRRGLYLVLANERGCAADYREERNGDWGIIPYLLPVESPQAGCCSGLKVISSYTLCFSSTLLILGSSKCSFLCLVSSRSGSGSTIPCLGLLHCSLWFLVSCLLP